MTVLPQGETLVSRVPSTSQAQRWQDLAPTLPSVTLGRRELLDLQLLAVGAFSPLTGYMTGRDYHAVVSDMHLANGTVWTLPITLAVSSEVANQLRDGSPVALRDAVGQLQGILELEERYTYDRAREAELVFRTQEDAHPGVRALYEQGDVLLGGSVWYLGRLDQEQFAQHILTPAAARAAFAERGWRTVVGFQTRNPIHRAHEYLQKAALEIVDGLFLHPLVGETKSDDIPADVRMTCYETLLRNYYPANRVVLGAFPARMRYAGPREAVFHALVRKNYGCTHFIVGRDHAGVGSYYGTYDAQRIFDEFSAEQLGITPLFFEHAFYCRRCYGMATTKTCGHADEYRVILSGTQVRNMLRSGAPLPPEFSRPEVAAVLMASMVSAHATTSPAARVAAELTRAD